MTVHNFIIRSHSYSVLEVFFTYGTLNLTFLHYIQYTIQHRTLLIISPLTSRVQTTIRAQILSIAERLWSRGWSWQSFCRLVIIPVIDCH